MASESNEKKYTERDLILAKREGAAYALNYFNVFEVTGAGVKARGEFCKNAYPLRVTRPRVVRDPHLEHGERYEWKVQNCELVFRNANIGGRWCTPDGKDGGEFRPTRERVAMWTDLLTQPEEEAEDDS